MGLYTLGRSFTARITRHIPDRARSACLANRRVFADMLEYGGAEGLRAEARRLGIKGRWLAPFESASDPALAVRLSREYVAMKEAQMQVGAEFRPHAIWQDLLDRDWAIGRSAAVAKDVEAFDAFLSHFFRNGGVSGVWGSGDMYRAFAEMDEWDDLARLDLFMRQLQAWRREVPGGKPADLAHGPVGDPWGYDIDGHVVIEPEMEYHELAGRVRKLLAPKSDPLVIEIGGGFGGFAAQLLKQMPAARYVGFDLPENVIIQSYHTSRMFPETRVLVNDSTQIGAAGTATFLPNWRLADAQIADADLLVNVRSFAEMSAETLAEYFKQIERIAPTWIYHENIAEGRRDDTHGIKSRDYPPLAGYASVAENESRWPRYDRESAYPCREHLLVRRSAFR